MRLSALLLAASLLPLFTGCDGGDVQCTADPPVFPAFDQSCSADEDCVLAIHQVECCGDAVVTGINAQEEADFHTAEQTCRPQYGTCACDGSFTADDGSLTSDPVHIQVTCQSGQCRTFRP